MFVVIYTARAKSPDDAQKVCALYSHDYALRIRPGLIRADCAIKVDDPCAILGVVYWGTEAARDVRTVSDDARRALAAIEPYLIAPSEAVVYEVR